MGLFFQKYTLSEVGERTSMLIELYVFPKEECFTWFKSQYITIFSFAGKQVSS